MQTISSAELSLLESYSPVHLHLYVGGAEIPAKLSTFNLTSAVGDEALNCGNSVASVMQVGAVAEPIYRILTTRAGEIITTRPENLFDTTWEQGQIKPATGLNASDSTKIRTAGFLRVTPGKIYTINRTIATGVINIRGYDLEQSYVGSSGDILELVSGTTVINPMSAGVTSCEIKIKSGVHYIRIQDYSNDLSTVYTMSTEPETYQAFAARLLWRGVYGQEIAVTWDVDGTTEHSLFQGKVEKCVVNSGRAQITAQDELFWNGSRLFAGQSNYQTTVSAQTVLETIASEMGVTLNAATSTLASGVSIYNGFSSCRDQLQLYQAAGYVAGILGGNAVINRDGELAVVRYATKSFSTEVYQGGSSAENENYAPSGVRFQRQITTRITNADGTISESDTIATYSAGDGSVEMENPLANKAAATRAYNALRSISSRKGTYSFPMGIQLEPGDVITVTTMDGTYPVAIVSQQLDIDGGVKSTVRGAGQMYPNGVNGTMTNTYTPTRNLMRSARLLGETADEEDEHDTDADEIFVPGHVGPVTQRLNSLELEMLKVKNLQAENAEITNANIQNIRAGNIDVDALLAQDATVTGSFQVNCPFWRLSVSGDGFSIGPVVEGDISSIRMIMNSTVGIDLFSMRQPVSISGGGGVNLYGGAGGVVAEDSVVIGYGIWPKTTATYDVGMASYRWKTIYLTTNPNVSSDRNVKHDISEDVPDIVDKLIPVQYKRKGDPETVYYGFIAQDVENALKQVGVDTDNIGLVTFETDAKGNKTNYALSYEEFIPLLTAKIQSQQKQIDSLTERLELLERMINDGR